MTPTVEGPPRPDRPGGRAIPHSESVSWEAWWRLHRFEFLRPADRSNEVTGEGPGPDRAPLRAKACAVFRILARTRDPEVRAAALAALARIPDGGREPDGRGLLATACSTDPVVAFEAGDGLVYARCPDLLPALHEAAQSRRLSPACRSLAALAIPRVAPELSDVLLADLARFDVRADPAVAGAVLAALGETEGAAGTAVLRRVVAEGRARASLRAGALTSLARRGFEAFDLLLASLSSPSVEVRRGAAIGLGILPWGSDPANAAAAEAVRSAAGLEVGDALAALLDRAEDERLAAMDGTRRKAVLRLGRMLSTDADATVRSAAAIALGRIAGAAGSPLAVRLLAECAERSHDAVREYALLALGLSKDPQALMSANAVLSAVSVSPSTRAAAAIALGLFGDPVVRPRLVALLRDDPNAPVRGHAAVALGMLRDLDARAAIRRGFDRCGNAEERAQLALALGLLGRTRDSDALVSALEGASDAGLRRDLAQSIRLMGDAGRLDGLLAIAVDPTSPARTDAIRAISFVLAPSDGRKIGVLRSTDPLLDAPAVRDWLRDP